MYKRLVSHLLVGALSLGFSAESWGAPIAPTEATPAMAPAPIAAAATPLELIVSDKLEVTSSRVQTLTFTQRALDTVSTAVEVEGQIWTLVLHKHSVRSPDFELLVQDATGALIPTAPPPVITVRGHVEELAFSDVRGSFDDGKLKVVVLTENESWGIQPLSDLGVDHAAGQHAVYRGSSWQNRGGYTCGTDETRHAFQGTEDLKLNPDKITPRGTGLKITEIGIDADVEFYQLNGSSVNNTLQDIELVINGVEAIYEAEAQITYDISTAIIRTAETDPYSTSDPEDLLTLQFQAHWNAQPQSFIKRDIAHLFTGKNINGGVIGIAYLNAICNSLSNGYGLSESRFTTNLASRYALTAHELGHNWSCPHCNDPNCSPFPNCCRIMCSGLGGCSGIITTFGTYSANQIIAYRNTRVCLSDLGDTQAVPFFEDFPSTTLNNAKWSYNNNGVINTNAMNEPSAPNAFELDAEGSQDYRDNELRTNFINLAGLSNVRLSYSTQHRGVENNEQLVVEYWANTVLWTEINRITSDGVDQTAFDMHTHILPANAHFNEFRVRFRSEVSDTGDDWFVDDVLVSSNCTLPSDCNDGLFCNGEEDCIGNVCIPGTSPCPDAEGPLCSESMDRCVNCLNNGHCSNGIFCDGVELCNGSGNCGPGTNPCTNPDLSFCLENVDQCVECLTGADCNDGMFCNGTEPCTLNSCGTGTNPCGPGLACVEAEDACQEPGDMYCNLPSGSASPNSTVPVDLYVTEVNNIRSYSSRVAITPISGTGTVSVVCPGGVGIDVNRSDYVFYNSPNDFPSPNCGMKQVGGALSTGFVHVGATPKYLGTIYLTVSGDATEGSTFDISLAPGAGTYLRDENNVLVTFDLLPACTLTIQECNSCQIYGDVEPSGSGAFIGDCDVDVDDLSCVLNDFVTPGICVTADIEPCGGDGDTDSDDILAELAAFSGSFACPDPCP